MGNWNINIQGHGAHHNRSFEQDANLLTFRFVGELVKAGHSIYHATFSYGSVDDFTPAKPVESVDSRAARAWEAYRDAVGGRSMGGDELPTWSEMRANPKKASVVRAWEIVARALSEPH